MIRSVLAAATLSIALAGAAQAATVVFSDNFDTETAGTNATLTNWDITAGSIDVIPVGPNFNWYGPGQYVDLNGSTRQAGRIETTNPLALVVGKAYTISFDYGNNKNSNGVEQLTFGIDGKTWVIDIPGAIPSLISIAQNFVYAGGSATLFFADTGNTPGDNGGPILDNVAVSTVPLPAGGLLLLAGLGGLAALRRRRAAA